MISGTGRRFSLPLRDVLLPPGGPFFGIDIAKRVRFYFAPPRLAISTNLFVDFFEHGDAPAAARPGRQAFGDLGSNLGLAQAAKRFHLPLGHVEAEADGIVVIEGHEGIVALKKRQGDKVRG